MHLRFHLLGGAFVALVMTSVRAESPATNTPPGPVEPPSATNAQPQTPAPPQAYTKSAPGAQSPNGANGINLKGKPVTKSPNLPGKKGRKVAATSTATPASASPTASAATSPAPAGATTPPASPSKQKTMSVLDNYLTDLNTTLHLTANEKNDIQTYYLQDGDELRDILNNSSISPLQQAARVSDLRDKRNDKIEALLGDVDRRHEFFTVEANYRVALTEAAATGALCPAQTPAPVPTPTDTTPGQAEPIPTPKTPVM